MVGNIAVEPAITRSHALWGRCLIISKPLAERTNGLLIQVTGRNYPGREHWAVYYPSDRADPTAGGQVEDRTCRQFLAEAPAVWKGDLDDWLDDCCEWLVDDVTYAVYSDTQKPALFVDFWVRDDIEPGPLVYPWQKGAP